MNEFDLIRRYFTRPSSQSVLGVGDDAAIVRPRVGYDLHMSVDMLVQDRHFFADVSPVALGHKTLAVNLSDMAAMGATPRWILLSLAVPAIDEAWVAGFAQGLYALASQYGVELIGGDTTRGPLTLSVTVLGEAPAGKALKRCAAQVGDDIWVTGVLGLGAVALRERLQPTGAIPAEVLEQCQQRLDFPCPRVEMGKSLLDLAHAAIDVSDGLLADLGHILTASAVGAELWAEALPSLSWLEADRSQWLECMAAGGDDYELCFTAPAHQRQAIEQRGRLVGCRVSRIGVVKAERSLQLLGQSGERIVLGRTGFDHFK